MGKESPDAPFSFEEVHRYRKSLQAVQKRAANVWRNKLPPAVLEDVDKVAEFLLRAREMQESQGKVEIVSSYAKALLEQAQQLMTVCKQRTTEVGRGEAELQALQKALTDLIARVQSFESREEAARRAEEAMRVRMEGLAEMETDVRSALDEHVSMSRTITEIIGRAEPMLQQCLARESAVRIAEEDVLKRTRALDQVKASLETRELTVKKHEEAVFDLKKERDRLEEELGRLRQHRLADVEAKEAALDNTSRAVETHRKETLLHARALSEREQQQVERNRRLDEWESTVKQRENALRDAENAVREKTTQVKELQDRVTELQRQREDLLQTLAALRAKI